MKTRLAKWCLMILLSLAVVGAIAVWFVSRQDDKLQRAVAETRLSLRKQGFKTDLADFNFSTSEELRARESALMVFWTAELPASPLLRLALMPAVTNDSAVVIWKKEWLPTDTQEILHWQTLETNFDRRGSDLDSACEAALSGPIRFNLDASQGEAMLLPHLASLKNLEQMLASRTAFELRRGNKDAAWTNFLALTRLITAWETEPIEVSHLVRFACVTIAYETTWQALQFNDWSDERLTRLQHEWESADLFKNLPETIAFQRARYVDFCQQERREPFTARFPFPVFVREMFHSPSSGWRDLRDYWARRHYRSNGTYEDEKALLLFYQNEEIQLRRAVQSPSWSVMRTIPGATNSARFISTHSVAYRIQVMMNMKELGLGFARKGRSFLDLAAEAESRRRLILAAIAAERSFKKNGTYPKSLQKLVPEFLKSLPIDFMDNNPLRYRATDDGRFVLYSVGLDCIDNGGKMVPHDWRNMRSGAAPVFGIVQGIDLVWPRPASAAEAMGQREDDIRQLEQYKQARLKADAEAEEQEEALRRATVEQLLTEKRLPRTKEPLYHGRPLKEVLRNEKTSGKTKRSLDELLTLRQFPSGQEPEIVTFEVPINYDAVTNIGRLYLFADGDPEECSSSRGAGMQYCSRATNGNCLLTWYTIFDPPGQHALQTQILSSEQDKDDFVEVKGPVASFYSSNIFQLDLSKSTFDSHDVENLRARLLQQIGIYTLELKSPDGEPIKSIKGRTTNGVINLTWDFTDENGKQCTNDLAKYIFNVGLPNLGQSQTVTGILHVVGQ